MTMTLDRIEPGQRVRVVEIGGSTLLRKRLIDMGILRGCCLCVQRVAPLGDPMELKLRGMSITLRKKEAAHIAVEGLGPSRCGAGRRHRGGRRGEVW